MDELLQSLLEAEVLSEDRKKELEQAIQTKLDEATEAAKNAAAADVRAELTEQWVKERDVLVEAVDSKVTEFLDSELSELKEDIERFRDLEADYAEKLVEARSDMSEELKSDLAELVEKIDAFLEIRLTAEMDELREDIDEVRKNEFGRKIYEAFAQEFMDGYSDEESAEANLREMEARLSDVETALEESERVRNDLERNIKMDKILSPLEGRQREVMEAILRNVDTAQLEEGYKTFIGRVIRETESGSEKEGRVLAEGEEKEGDEDEDDEKGEKKDKKESKKDEKDEKESDDKSKKEVKEGLIVTGDKEEMIKENVDPVEKQRLDYLKKLAGIIK